MNTTKKPRSLGTHDGTFHADEVTACALLLLFDLIDEDKITRTRDSHKLEQCDFVCDVGRVYDPKSRLFDHHQADYAGELSSAGMVLLYLKEESILNEMEYNYFRDSLFIGVDALDNGFTHNLPGFCTYSDVITNYTPIEYNADEEDETRAFHEALKFSYQHLKRLWQRYRYIRSCKKIVENEMKKKKDYLLFDKAIPWQELFFELKGVDHPAKFVIMPSGTQWILRGIPPSLEDRMSVRVPLPQTWAGLFDEDLQKVSGIKGAVFCHKGLFISVWEKKDDAINALQYVLENKET